MTATAEETVDGVEAKPEIRTRAQVRRERTLGGFYLALAIFTLYVFAIGSEGSSTFRLVRASDRFPDFPNLVVPAFATSLVIALVFLVFGVLQLTRGFGKRTNVVLGVAAALFVFSFLTWAAADQSFSLVSMLDAAVVASVPLTIGALAGILCERVAVINIAIEGMLLGGAFTGVVVASAFTSVWFGVLAAVLTGGALAWVLAVMSIRYRVDQIITGVVINIFVLGLTSFLTVQVLAANADLNSAPRVPMWDVPLLSDIPLVGGALFQQSLFVYFMLVLVVVTTYALFRTRWGLRSRSVGEHPKAADTVGINVYRMRYLGVMLGGLVAGLGGAFFTLGRVGRFDENLTAGRGFIALAAMIFGRWHPVGALSAALVFGFADALANKLAILGTGIPSEFLLMSPYLATLIVVAGVVGKSRPPAADGQPYIKE
ncbi:MAG: ABC transporter permease [Acidimicrobiia bacterium]